METTKNEIINLLASPEVKRVGDYADTSEFDDYAEMVIILENKTKIKIESAKYNCGGYYEEIFINGISVHDTGCNGCWQHSHQWDGSEMSKSITKIVMDKI